MDNQYYYDMLFPSIVVYKDHEIDNKINLIDFSKKIINQYGNNAFYSECLSTVKTKNDILNFPEFSQIKQHVIDTLGAFCESMKIDRTNLTFTGSWLNLYNIGGYQDLHHHSDSTISGIYYLDSDSSKDLIFQAPWHFFQPIEAHTLENNLTNCHNVEYNSFPGRCYIFMSHLMHRTMPAKSQRISISFNIKSTKIPR